MKDAKSENENICYDKTILQAAKTSQKNGLSQKINQLDEFLTTPLARFFREFLALITLLVIILGIFFLAYFLLVNFD